MTLFRAGYIREGAVVGVTFFAAGENEARAFAVRWEEGTKLFILSLKREPKSPFRGGVYRRRKV